MFSRQRTRIEADLADTLSHSIPRARRVTAFVASSHRVHEQRRFKQRKNEVAQVEVQVDIVKLLCNLNLLAKKSEHFRCGSRSDWRDSERVCRALLCFSNPPEPRATLCSSNHKVPPRSFVFDYLHPFSRKTRAGHKQSEHVVIPPCRRPCLHSAIDLSLPSPTHSKGHLRQRRSIFTKPTEASQDKPTGSCLP